MHSLVYEPIQYLETHPFLIAPGMVADVSRNVEGVPEPT
jgi:hypothetical protein